MSHLAFVARVAVVALLCITSSAASAAYYSVYRGKAYVVTSQGRIPGCRLWRCPMCDDLQGNFRGATSPLQAFDLLQPRRISARPRVPSASSESRGQPTDDHQPRSMPHDAIVALFQIIQPKPIDVVYDLGCGDGRILSYAQQNFGCQIVGVEIDEAIAEACIENLERQGCSGTIVQGDATECDLFQADVITLYQFGNVMQRLHWETLAIGTVVASYGHPIPGLDDHLETGRVNGVDYEFYVYYHGI